MQVINSLIEDSFAYTGEKENIGMRRDEIGDLMEIVAYCQDEAVKEPMEYQDTLWEIYVQEGITFTDWLYGGGIGNDEDRRRLMEALSKKEMVQAEINRPIMEERNIQIALGEFPQAVSNVKEYIKERREILSSLKNAADYESFIDRKSTRLNSSHS